MSKGGNRLCSVGNLYRKLVESTCSLHRSLQMLRISWDCRAFREVWWPTPSGEQRPSMWNRRGDSLRQHFFWNFEQLVVLLGVLKMKHTVAMFWKPTVVISVLLGFTWNIEDIAWNCSKYIEIPQMILRTISGDVCHDLILFAIESGTNPVAPSCRNQMWFLRLVAVAVLQISSRWSSLLIPMILKHNGN